MQIGAEGSTLYINSVIHIVLTLHTHTSQCMVVMLESNDGRGGTFHSGGAVHVHLPFNQVFCGRIFVGK